MAEDQIRYDVLTQEALRGVIRKVLEEVEVGGLPGEHHFFITFDTTHPGVRLSKRMYERYPESMTIVIQHTYWNLKTSDTGFELDLTFNDIRERLCVPFAAVQAFFDPSVKFGLQFEVDLAAAESGIEAEHEVVELPKKNDGKTSVPLPKPAPAAATTGEKPKSSTPGLDKTIAKKPEDKQQNGASGDVVSLDSFRKK